MYHHKTEYLIIIIIIKENKINDISINKIKTRRYMISLSANDATIVHPPSSHLRRISP